MNIFVVKINQIWRVYIQFQWELLNKYLEQLPGITTRILNLTVENNACKISLTHEEIVF